MRDDLTNGEGRLFGNGYFCLCMYGGHDIIGLHMERMCVMIKARIMSVLFGLCKG